MLSGFVALLVCMHCMFLWNIQVSMCLCVSLVNASVRCQRHCLRSGDRNAILGCGGEVAVVAGEIHSALPLFLSPLSIWLLTHWPAVYYSLMGLFYFDILCLKKWNIFPCYLLRLICHLAFFDDTIRRKCPITLKLWSYKKHVRYTLTHDINILHSDGVWQSKECVWSIISQKEAERGLNNTVGENWVIETWLMLRVL